MKILLDLLKLVVCYTFHRFINCISVFVLKTNYI
jgi:hypothetical protein